MIKRYPVGCKSIDDMLSGGIEAGIITQIYGESGSGKTNLAIQFANTFLTENSDAKVIYIDTEGLSAERVHQVLGNDSKVHTRFILYNPINLEEQRKNIEELKTVLPAIKKAAVIVDSLTVFYRKDVNTEGDTMARKVLNDMIVTLLALARRNNIPVIVTNQVYTDTESGINMPLGGNVLAHNTKTIIELIKLSQGQRLARLVHHRSIKMGRDARFIITSNGLRPI